MRSMTSPAAVPAPTMTWAALLVAASGLLSGCGTVIHEKHYFAAFVDNPEGKREPVQFYRLSVDGDTQFSNTRYLTGYFDERAVSLFFNELKSNPATSSTHKLFEDDRLLPGTNEKLTPLTPKPEDGAFVLIMSTNADAVASTIGAFAESQVVADALTGLFNRDRIKSKIQSDAKLAVQKAEGGALATQVEAQIDAATAAGSGTLAAAAYLRALTALARGLGYSGAEFANTDAARAFFTLESSRSGGTP